MDSWILLGSKKMSSIPRLTHANPELHYTPLQRASVYCGCFEDTSGRAQDVHREPSGLVRDWRRSFWIVMVLFCREHSLSLRVGATSNRWRMLQSHQLGEALFDEAANGWLDSEPAVDELIQLVGAQSASHSGKHRTSHSLLGKQKSPRSISKNSNDVHPLLSWWQIANGKRFLSGLQIPKANPRWQVLWLRVWTRNSGQLFGTMCAGIYADAPEHMSVRAAFPNLWKMAANGSILWQLIQHSETKMKTTPTSHP